jgi:hypothetical protein
MDHPQGTQRDAAPEARAWQAIDAALTAAGWIVQDRAEVNLHAGPGIAVREPPHRHRPGRRPLFLDGRACGATLEAGSSLRAEICRPLAANPALRRAILEAQRSTEIIVDELTPDAALSAGFDLKRAAEITGRFSRFLAEEQDRLAALAILYARPQAQRRLTHAMLHELRAAMACPPWLLDDRAVWACHRRLHAGQARAGGAGALRAGCEPQLRTLARREKRTGRDHTEERRHLRERAWRFAPISRAVRRRPCPCRRPRPRRVAAPGRGWAGSGACGLCAAAPAPPATTWPAPPSRRP